MIPYLIKIDQKTATPSGNTQTDTHKPNFIIIFIYLFTYYLRSFIISLYIYILYNLVHSFVYLCLLKQLKQTFETIYVAWGHSFWPIVIKFHRELNYVTGYRTEAVFTDFVTCFHFLNNLVGMNLMGWDLLYIHKIRDVIRAEIFCTRQKYCALWHTSHKYCASWIPILKKWDKYTNFGYYGYQT